MLDAAPASLCAHANAYGLPILTIVALLSCAIAYVDFRTFRIPNGLLLLLPPLYVLYSAVAGRWSDVLGDIVFAALVFATCLLFYSRKALGGGDVKFLPLTCLFVGIRDAVPFCGLLILFVLAHYAAARIGWVRLRLVAGRRMLPYAPSITGAFLVTLALGCYFAHSANSHALQLTRSIQLQQSAE